MINNPKTVHLFENHIRGLLAPDPMGDIVDWLEKNVKEVPGSPQPGPFRIESTPYLAPILRALLDPEITTIVVMGAVQMGKSSLLELWSSYIPARAPGPTLLLQDVDDNAQDWQKDRLRPMWEATPETFSKMEQAERNQWKKTRFQRNTIWVLGANNKKNLQRRSIRYLGGDEVWLWPKGHLSEALARRTAFIWQGKTLLVSQGGFEGDDFTNLWYQSDRRELTFACLECGFRQPWEWEQIIYPEDAKGGAGWDIDKVKENCTYECKNCKHRYKDSFIVRQELNKTLQYVPMNPGAPKGIVGFHWNSLCAQWGLDWGKLAELAIRAKQAFDEHGDETLRIEFKQKRLAMPWAEDPDEGGGEVMPQSYKMLEIWENEGAMVDGKLQDPPITDEHKKSKVFARLRFMSVDCQRKGFYWIVRAWSIDGKSRMVQWGYCDTEEQLRETQLRHEVSPLFVFVDSGDGPNTDATYRMCARYGWNATKGSGQNEFPHRIQTPYGIKISYRPYQKAKVIQVGQSSCKLYLYSNLVLKDSLTRLRRSGQHTYPEDSGDEYRKQMQSEHRTKSANGQPIWLPIGERANHLFDCETMGVLPAIMARLVGRNKLKAKSVDNKDAEKEVKPGESIDEP